MSRSPLQYGESTTVARHAWFQKREPLVSILVWVFVQRVMTQVAVPPEERVGLAEAHDVSVNKMLTLTFVLGFLGFLLDLM